MTTNTFNDVAVAMITRNEEKAIEKVIVAIKGSLPGAKIYVVDDSSDETKQIATACGAIVFDGPRRGFGPAFIQALLTPIEPIVVTIDADDTYPVTALPILIELIRDGAEVAGANRLGLARPKTMPFSNYIMNLLLSKYASLRSGVQIRDVHSGQRAYRREVLHGFKWDFGYDALPIDLIFIPALCGLNVVEIPIEYLERIGVTTLNRWSSGKASLKRLSRSRSTILGSKLPK